MDYTPRHMQKNSTNQTSTTSLKNAGWLQDFRTIILAVYGWKSLNRLKFTCQEDSGSVVHVLDETSKPRSIKPEHLQFFVL